MTAFDFRVSDSAQSFFKLLGGRWVFFSFPYLQAIGSFEERDAEGRGRALLTLTQNFTSRRERQGCVLPGGKGQKCICTYITFQDIFSGT